MKNRRNENPTIKQNHLKPSQVLAAGIVSLSAALALSGCGLAVSGDSTAATSTLATARITGNVHGGQQPVTGSTIQLYTVGTSGLQSASTAMLTSTVQTDSSGNFTITGLYDCTTLPATQVYITASGGNPGTGTNSALAMTAALGACTNLTSSTFINIDEITTVAAAYALAPFASDIAHVGASGSNPTGLVNAFTNAALLANTALGTAGGTLAAGVTIPASEINTLGDIIAACVNTTGSASAGCTSLFSATGAADTFGAAMSIAKNPSASAVTGLYTLATASAPFQPTLTSQPNDFTVAVTSSASSTLATPYGIAIDAAGHAWITNEAGSSVSELGVDGSLLASPTSTGLTGAQGIAVDRSGNVWVANSAGNSVVKFAVTSGSVTGSSSFTAGGVNTPVSVALDSAGNAFVANFNGNSVTGLSASGTALSGSPFAGGGNITVPSSVAVSPSGSIYVTSGSGSVINLTNAGAYVASLNDGTLQGPASVLVDTSGRVLATGFTTGTSVGGALSQFTSAGAALASSPYTSSLSTPAGIASDGSSIWVANTGGSLAQFSYSSSAALSPAAGFGSLSSPVGVAVDSSGSVWTTNSGNNTVSKFIGLASPVTTPMAANVGP